MHKCLLSLLLALSTLPALAHGNGDGHDEPAAPVATVDGAPRAATQTEEFELVAVLESGSLTLYLDRYGSNEPVPDAQVEVESGAQKATAKQVAPGMYSIPAETFVSPGQHPLAVSVQAGDSSDLLSLTLDVPKPSAGIEPARDWRAWTAWSGVGAILLLSGGFVVARSRRRSRGQRIAK